MVIHVIRVISDNNIYQKSPKIITAKVYRVEGISKKQAEILAEKLFCEKINQKYSIDKPILRNVSFVTEIAYKPGVMNPETASIIKAAKDLSINVKAADSSIEYGFYGKIKKEKIEEIIKNLKLFNPFIYFYLIRF